jgi:hypothetical protein
LLLLRGTVCDVTTNTFMQCNTMKFKDIKNKSLLIQVDVICVVTSSQPEGLSVNLHHHENLQSHIKSVLVG